MTAYDFHNLSPLEFEDISRDLLQRHLGIPLEVFAPGKDEGIDLRHCSDKGRTLIAQCKHLIATGYTGLRANLKRERPKIESLAPARYIVVTSVQLTPNNKREIKKILSPFVLRASDILGLRELNGLLRDFPEVERTHFKLWLTSLTVLQSIVHSAAFNQTLWAKDRIRARARLYVQNKCFAIAKAMLDEHGFCIIAGNPGIGKTTLAEMLVLDHLGHGFEAFKVEHHISELKELATDGVPQIFYYDDFLGQTSFEDKLEKNEDKALISLIDKIRRSKVKAMRLILTTREYILATAKRHYGPLAEEDWHPFQCVVSLADYSRADRARILYNHLYFSDLSIDYKTALLRDPRLLSIIDHEHYSPRIIDWMTDQNKCGDCTPSQYVTQFLKRLESPQLIWQDAVDNRIQGSSRHLLLTLGSFGSEVRHSDLRRAWEAFYSFRGTRYGFTSDPLEFKRALRELDGNFISISKAGATGSMRFVQFQNPSIKDCIESYMKRNLRDVGELCRTALFFEQLVGIWNSVWRASPGGAPKIFWKALQRTFGASSCTYCQSDMFAHIIPARVEVRAHFVLEIAGSNPSEAALACATFVVERLVKNSSSEGLASSFVSMIAAKLSGTIAVTSETREKGLAACKSVLLGNAERHGVLATEFGEVVQFIKRFPGALSVAEVDTLRDRFVDSLDGVVRHVASSIEDYQVDEIEQRIEVAKKVASALAVPANDHIVLLEEACARREAYDENKAEEVESWDTPSEESDDEEEASDDEILQMFDTLLESST